MDTSMLAATIYFVGIAAVVTAPPGNDVTKAVIFPEASQGGNYMGTDLVAHDTTLNLRVQDFAPGTPDDFCERIGGAYDETRALCRVPLSGARLWTRTQKAQPLTEDNNFRRLPSFLTYNPNALNLPDEYNDVNSVDPEYVAARFEITGGALSGCNRGAQYVVSLGTTGELSLFLEQAERTVQIVLNRNAVVAIQNRPRESAHPTMMSSSGAALRHFGWYYAMNGRHVSRERRETQPLAVPTNPAPISRRCPANIPADWDAFFIHGMSGAEAASSAECSPLNFPG
jgi:hypothetical protein